MAENETEKTMQDRVRLICIRTFFSNGRGNPLAMIAGGAILALFLYYSGSSTPALLCWLLLVIVCACLAFLFDQHVFRKGVSHENAELFLKIRIGLGAIVALLFGLSTLLITESFADRSGLFGLLVVTTLVTLLYMTSATVFRYCVLVNMLAVLPYLAFLTLRFLERNDHFALIEGVTCLVWNLVVVRKGWAASRYAVGLIRTGERLNDEMEERLVAVNALRASEEHAQQLATMLRLLCDNVPDMIWAKDLDNRFIFVNKAYALKILGAPDTSEPVGRTYADYFVWDRSKNPGDPQWHTLGEFSADIDLHTLTRDEPTVFEEDGYVRGRKVCLDIHQSRFVNGSGDVIGIVGSARDIAERKESEAYVRHIAHHDVLTDLPNRLLLSDRLKIALAQARRDRSRLALLFIDLDNLKPVNDTLGHDIGDLLLKEVAVRLCQAVSRNSDTVARLGGDEFVVVLSRINRDSDATCVAERILGSLSEPLTIAGHTLNASASLGIALYPQHGEDEVSLLRNADSAMYAAKHAGRNTFRYYGGS